MKKIVAFIAAFAMVITTFGFSAPALSQASAAEKMITGVAPDGAKVAVDWNVRYPYADLEKQFQDLNAAYPQYSELESIGKTYQDRDMMCMTITDEAIPAAKKTEVTVFGNIHGGEGESQRRRPDRNRISAGYGDRYGSNPRFRLEGRHSHIWRRKPG